MKRNDLIGKLDRSCFTYQLVDRFYSLLKSSFSGSLLVKNGENFESVEKAVSFNKLSKAMDKMASIGKKTFTQKIERVFAVFDSKIVWSWNEWINFFEASWTSQKANFELKLMKIIDCFLDGYASYMSILVSFKRKTSNSSLLLKQLHTLITKKSFS